MLFLRKTLINSLLFIVFYSVFFSLFFALIHATFTINTISSVVGLTLFLSSIFLYFNNKILVKEQLRLAPTKQIVPTQNLQTTIYTNGGNYNEKIGGDFIGRDSVKKNIKKNINIKNEQLEIGYDISEILGDLKDSLNEMIVKSSDPVETVSYFAKELAEELRKNPELKASLDDKENSSEQELANKIIIDLLTKTYDQISQITRTEQINQSSQIQKVNTSSALEYTYYTPNNENEYGNDRDTRQYNGYTIYLAKDHENMWNFEIQREDASFLDLSKQRRFSSKDNAIGTAKKKIDKDRMANWRNNYLT